MQRGSDPRAPGRVATRVRYPETDRMGVAWHGHYLAWFELGRTELMRQSGCAYGALEDRLGLFFPVIEASARYHAPARYDDALWIETRLADLGGVRVRFEYEITRQDDGTRLASGWTRHAAVGRSGRPRRLPDEVRHALAGRLTMTTRSDDQ